MNDKHDIMRLLIRAEKARRQVLQPLLASIGLTFGQGHVRILNTLHTEDGITQKELADRCRMDEATISRNLDKLSRSGYLERKPDPASRRSFLICLTEEGRREAETLRHLLAYVDDQFWAGLTEEDMEIFARYLEKICENLENCPLP